MLNCGECTLCCDLFPVRWLDKPPNSSCKFCEGGCTIHKMKPPECSDFNCAYVQMKKGNIELRPDKCGIIFEKLSDKIFFGTVDPKREPSDLGKRQAFNFVEQGYSVVLASSKRVGNLFLINKNHNEEEIRRELSERIAAM